MVLDNKLLENNLQTNLMSPQSWAVHDWKTTGALSSEAGKDL